MQRQQKRAARSGKTQSNQDTGHGPSKQPSSQAANVSRLRLAVNASQRAKDTRKCLTVPVPCPFVPAPSLPAGRIPALSSCIKSLQAKRRGSPCNEMQAEFYLATGRAILPSFHAPQLPTPPSHSPVRLHLHFTILVSWQMLKQRAGMRQ